MALLSSTGGSSRPVLLDLVLHEGDRLLGLVGTAVHDLPPRALGQVPPDEDDDDAEDRPDRETDAPGDARLELVEQDEGADVRQQGAEPVGPVDHDVDAAAELRRDQLVDGRVDRRVLAADAHAGDEPRGVEEHQPTHAVAQRQRREPAADEVDGQGDREQVAPAQPVRQRTEHERADHLADQINGGQQPHLGGREPQRVRMGQRVADGAGDADLQAVEDPRDPQRCDHAGVERGPGKAVDTSRDQAPHGSTCGNGHGRPVSLKRGRQTSNAK
jgi:hypothetical protein